MSALNDIVIDGDAKFKVVRHATSNDIDKLNEKIDNLDLESAITGNVGDTYFELDESGNIVPMIDPVNYDGTKLLTRNESVSVGDKRYLSNVLPSGAWLECIQAGVTSNEVPAVLQEV